MATNHVPVPPGVVKEPTVRPLTEEQQALLAARRSEYFARKNAEAKARWEARQAVVEQKLAELEIQYRKPEHKIPASNLVARKNNNGYDFKVSGEVNWAKQDKIMTGSPSKKRLSAKAARSASKHK